MEQIAISPVSKPKRVYVQVTDPRTKKSKSFTLHGITVSRALRLLRRGVELATTEEKESLPNREVA